MIYFPNFPIFPTFFAFSGFHRFEIQVFWFQAVVQFADFCKFWLGGQPVHGVDHGGHGAGHGGHEACHLSGF